jgi:site-specific recombinase XerD
LNKPQANPLPALVQNFFIKYLIAQRQLSPCTVASYRDTFRLLFAYQETRIHRTVDQQCLEDWDAPHILSFLDHLEKERDCCPRTRNVRLAALHCFMRYVAQEKPEFLAR